VSVFSDSVQTYRKRGQVVYQLLQHWLCSSLKAKPAIFWGYVGNHSLGVTVRWQW